MGFKVTGQVNKRPEKNIKLDVLNGDVELEVIGIEVLNKADTGAIDISTDGHEIGEEHRLEYRYLIYAEIVCKKIFEIGIRLQN